jgi:hypothetical protein
MRCSVSQSCLSLLLAFELIQLLHLQCKNVISKLQRRIDKEGQQIVPLLTDLWKRIENSGYSGGSGNSLLDLRKIDQRIEKLEYNGATDLVSDVQLMLKSAMHYYGFSLEVRFLILIIIQNGSLLWLLADAVVNLPQHGNDNYLTTMWYVLFFFVEKI